MTSGGASKIVTPNGATFSGNTGLSESARLRASQGSIPSSERPPTSTVSRTTAPRPAARPRSRRAPSQITTTTATELTPYHFVPAAIPSAIPARTRSERRLVRAWRRRKSTPQANVVHMSESGSARGIVAIPTTGSETTTAPASTDAASGARSSRATAKTAIAVVTR